MWAFFWCLFLRNNRRRVGCRGGCIFDFVCVWYLYNKLIHRPLTLPHVKRCAGGLASPRRDLPLWAHFYFHVYTFELPIIVTSPSSKKNNSRVIIKWYLFLPHKLILSSKHTRNVSLYVTWRWKIAYLQFKSLSLSPSFEWGPLNWCDSHCLKKKSLLFRSNITLSVRWMGGWWICAVYSLMVDSNCNHYIMGCLRYASIICCLTRTRAASHS